MRQFLPLLPLALALAACTPSNPPVDPPPGSFTTTTTGLPGRYFDNRGALKRAQVSWQNEQQLRFVLREGRKRQIRRMCEQVGLKVVGLKRVRMGSVTLGKLPVGQWRFLRPDERL